MTTSHEGAAPVVAVAAVLTNPVGLHARPSVKLTRLAKQFGCKVEIALAAQGPWVDAKSPVQVMRVRAAQGMMLYIRARGAGADLAAKALLDLVHAEFDEGTGDARG